MASGDRQVCVVVVTAGRSLRVVDASPVVPAPSFGGASRGPDAAVPDDVSDAECAGVGSGPAGELPANIPLGGGGETADVADSEVAGAASGMVAGGVPEVGVPAVDAPGPAIEHALDFVVGVEQSASDAPGAGGV